MKFDFSYLDIAFKNGSVITVNDTDEIAEAVGIKGNKIVFVGSNADIGQLIDEHTKVYDLAGRTLMPGINDTHYHPILNGMIAPELDSAMVDTGLSACKTIPELLDLIRRIAATKKPGQWISTMGYEAGLLAEQRHPTLEELDAAAPNNPLQCCTCNGHISTYNSKALEYLGVYGPEDASKYPEGEVVVENGKLTGLVRGHTHFWLWGQVEYTTSNCWKMELPPLATWASAIALPTTLCRRCAAAVSSRFAAIWRFTAFSASPTRRRTMSTG